MEHFRDNPISTEELIQQFRLQVKTELEALTDVLQWFEQITYLLVEENRLSEKCGWQCKLALAEAFTNTVRYAHPHLPATTPIDLEVNLFSQFLEIRMWNWGNPFNLQEKLNSLGQSRRDPLEQESDRGLFFMQELTDELQYIRLFDQRNCLIMRKKILE